MEITIWVIVDILIAIGVIITSIMFLKMAPKDNTFRTIKYWHIFNSVVVIGLLLFTLFGVHWPSYVQFIMIALILANNFAATLSSVSRLNQEQTMALTFINSRANNSNIKELIEWKPETLSQSQQQ